MPEKRLEPGELLHIKGPVWLLAGEGQGRFPRCHAILIKDRRTCLIDPGCGPTVINGFLRENRVDLVLNSHSHPDHTSGNYLFPETEIWAPEMARNSAGRLMPLSGRFVKGAQLSATWRGSIARDVGFRDRKPDAWFGHGHEFQVGDTRLLALHTPGHTADHFCFHLPDLNLLISGDLDLTSFGPWYGHRESSLAQTRESLAAALSLEPEVWVSSHRLPVAGADIAVEAARFAGVIEERSQRILGLVDIPATMEVLVEKAPIYGRFPYWPAIMRHWEETMIMKHLEELMKRGQVRRVGPAYQTV